MSISDTLEEVKKALHNKMRDRRFAKKNLERAEKAALTSELATCNGKLNSCKTNFKHTIREQCAKIEEGRKKGFDTVAQEQIVWDAAIGYMLVVDAMYALQSISSYDSMTRAYEMLDAASKQMSGQKSRLAIGRGNAKSGRTGYAHINSPEVVKSKEELLDSFFAMLLQTGDIEGCLNNARHPAIMEGERRSAYTSENIHSSAGMGEGGYDRYLSQIPDDGPEEELDLDRLAEEAMTNPSRPKTDH